MKKLHPLLSVLFLISVGISQNKVDVDNLIKRGDKYYKPNDDKPFTGSVFQFYPKSDVKSLEGRMVNGLFHGVYKEYWNDGTLEKTRTFKNGHKIKEIGYYGDEQKSREGNYKKVLNEEYDEWEDVENGLHTEWYRNGQKKSEVNYVDGKYDGQYTTWYKNGQKKSEVNYVDGKKEGQFTGWLKSGEKSKDIIFKNGKKWGEIKIELYPSGKKKSEGGRLNGKKDGLWTEWYKNGQKSFEATYKDGKAISSKFWNSDGSVKK